MSKIFDEYAKLAEERGLISKEAYPMDKRVESRALSDIEILYGIKPNGKEDDKDIVEQAHPETCVMAPAYDKMNGIVENQNQLADIMRNIALRPPNGLYQQKRFVSAQQDLVESLVRIGFLMDNKGEEDLMKLADSCAGRLEKKALPLAVPIIVGIVGSLGLLAILNRTDYSLQNVVNNTEMVIRELNDLQGKMDVTAILNDMLYLQKLANEFESASKAVGKPALNDAQDVLQASQKHPGELKVAKKYRAVLDIIGPKIADYKRYIETAPVASEYKYDWMQKVEDVGRTLFSVTTDKEDVINALGGLEKAVAQAKKEVDYLMNRAQQAKPTLETQLAEYQKAEDAHNPSMEL